MTITRVEVAQVRTWTCLRVSKRQDQLTVVVPRSVFATPFDAVSDGKL
ncbi:hypothetical protein [Streptomyces sp. NBC_00094]|nr:hypothetical protein [Streptomyces sp. NBC_00094]MCX5388503.1 hypothetical protein [Streptomyces sp. NBC_00094]